jgi:DNA-binding transcriptional regulator YhcF (GntR family)
MINNKSDREKGSEGPVYIQLAKVLKNRIQNGRYKATGKLESENELCQLFSRSRPTIRRALDFLVTQGLVKRVPKRGYFLEHSIPTQSTDQSKVAVLSNMDYESSRPTPDSIPPIRQMLRLGDLYRYHLQHTYFTDPDAAISFLLQPPTDLAGAIIFRPPAEWVDKLLLERRALIEGSLPLVVMNRNLTDSGLNFVTSEFGQPIKESLRYLGQLGHKKIGLILGNKRDIYNEEIYESFTNYTIANDLPHSDDMVCEIDDYNPMAYCGLIEKFLQKPLPFTALIIAGDIFLPDTLRILEDKKISFPKDLSIIASCQKDTLGPQYESLTAFYQPVRDVCEECFEVISTVLKGQLGGVCQTQIEFAFNLGNSCAPLK